MCQYTEVWLQWCFQSNHLCLSRINLKALSHLSPHLIFTLQATGAEACHYPHPTNGKTKVKLGWPTTLVCPRLKGFPGCGTSSAKTREVLGKLRTVGHSRWSYRTCHITRLEMSKGLESGLQTLSFRTFGIFLRMERLRECSVCVFCFLKNITIVVFCESETKYETPIFWLNQCLTTISSHNITGLFLENTPEGKIPAYISQGNLGVY